MMSKVRCMMSKVKGMIAKSQLIEKTKLILSQDTLLLFLLQENNELIKIIAKSIATTKSNQK